MYTKCFLKIDLIHENNIMMMRIALQCCTVCVKIIISNKAQHAPLDFISYFIYIIAYNKETHSLAGNVDIALFVLNEWSPGETCNLIF